MDDAISTLAKRRVRCIDEVGSFDAFGSRPIKISEKSVEASLVVEVPLGTGDIIMVATSEDYFGDVDIDGFRLTDFPSKEAIIEAIELVFHNFNMIETPDTKLFIEECLAEAFWT